MSALYFCPWCKVPPRTDGKATVPACPHCMDNVALPCPRCWCPGCKIARVNDDQDYDETFKSYAVKMQANALNNMGRKELHLTRIIRHTTPREN